VHAPEIVKQYHQRRPLEDKSKKNPPKSAASPPLHSSLYSSGYTLKKLSKPPPLSTSSLPLTVHLRTTTTSTTYSYPVLPIGRARTYAEVVISVPLYCASSILSIPKTQTRSVRLFRLPNPLLPLPQPPIKCLPLLLAMSLASPPRPSTSPARHPPMPHPSQSQSPPRRDPCQRNLVPQRSFTPPCPKSLLHPTTSSPHYLSRYRCGPISNDSYTPHATSSTLPTTSYNPHQLHH